jgi:hypothetical protein
MSDTDGRDPLRDLYSRALAWMLSQDSSTEMVQQVVRNLLEDSGTTQNSRITAWLAGLADSQLREIAGTLAVPRNVTGASVISISGGLAMAPMGMGGTVTTVVPLPADTIAGEVKPRDVNYAGLVLLSILCWLVFIAGPGLILKLPSGDQATAADYVNALPAIAVALTVYVLAAHKRK